MRVAEEGGEMGEVQNRVVGQGGEISKKTLIVGDPLRRSAVLVRDR